MRDVPCQMGILPSPLELQGCYVGGETRNETGHFPRPQRDRGCTDGAALDLTVMLSESPARIWCGAYIKTGMLDGRAEQVAAIKGGNGLHLHKLFAGYPAAQRRVVRAVDCYGESALLMISLSVSQPRFHVGRPFSSNI
jgi:hypothetical protein